MKMPSFCSVSVVRAAGLAAVACGCFAFGTANADTTYYASDFNSFADNATVLAGGSNSLTAYGLPTQFGLIRDDGNGGKALNIYGGEAFNGASSGAFGGLSDRIGAGETMLRMTGVYRTTPAYDSTPWNQTAEIQFQNNVGYFTYNTITVSASTPSWTPFTLDLNLSGLDPSQLGQVQANFFIPGNNPGQFQVDDLTIKATAVPEPTTFWTLAAGVTGLLATGWSRRRKA